MNPEYGKPNTTCPVCRAPAIIFVHDDGSWMRFCEVCQLLDGHGPKFEDSIKRLPPEWSGIKIRRGRPVQTAQ